MANNNFYGVYGSKNSAFQEQDGFAEKLTKACDRDSKFSNNKDFNLEQSLIFKSLAELKDYSFSRLVGKHTFECKGETFNGRDFFYLSLVDSLVFEDKSRYAFSTRFVGKNSEVVLIDFNEKRIIIEGKTISIVLDKNTLDETTSNVIVSLHIQDLYNVGTVFRTELALINIFDTIADSLKIEGVETNYEKAALESLESIKYYTYNTFIKTIQHSLLDLGSNYFLALYKRCESFLKLFGFNEGEVTSYLATLGHGYSSDGSVRRRNKFEYNERLDVIEFDARVLFSQKPYTVLDDLYRVGILSVDRSLSESLVNCNRLVNLARAKTREDLIHVDQVEVYKTIMKMVYHIEAMPS